LIPDIKRALRMKSPISRELDSGQVFDRTRDAGTGIIDGNDVYPVEWITGIRFLSGFDLK